METLDADTVDLAKTLLHNAATMDEEVLQRGIELMREIRRAHTNAAYQLECILRALERAQAERLTKAM